MTSIAKTLEIRTSPHVASGNRVDTIMFHVVLALLPAAGFAVYAFGLAGLMTLTVATGTCVLVEHWVCRASGKVSTVTDWSVVITGLLYGLTLPPGLPIWMVVVGGVFAVALGKSIFGGLGGNPFNPALIGRAFLQAAFPVSMTSWMPSFADGRFAGLPTSVLAFPFTTPVYDATSGATPLSAWKFEKVATDATDLMLGLTSGSTGETCALLLVAGGLYLSVRKMMNWRIPVAILGTVFVLTELFHAIDPAAYPSGLFMLFSGGLMLGAMFMATDMVGSPITGLGSVVYGVIIGLLVVVIRLWGGMPEGVMYAILLGNALAPHIDQWIQPRVYGTGRLAPRGAGT